MSSTYTTDPEYMRRYVDTALRFANIHQPVGEAHLEYYNDSRLHHAFPLMILYVDGQYVEGMVFNERGVKV
jgi:hypothetical protein